MITKSNTDEINFCALFTYKSVHIKTFQLQRLLYTHLYKSSVCRLLSMAAKQAFAAVCGDSSYLIFLHGI